MYEYAVDAARPVSEYVVPLVTVPICVPPLYILYPVTPTLSVDAVQESATDVCVMFEAERFVGMEGGVVSGAAVTVTVTDCVAVPPVPVQARVYVVVTVGETD